MYIYIYILYLYYIRTHVFTYVGVGVSQVLEAHGLLASLRAQMLRLESSHLTNALAVARQGQPWATWTEKSELRSVLSLVL